MRIDKKAMLIVEDNEDMQSLLVNIFDEEGYQTITAKNGAAAIKIFRDQNIDIILLDKRLPDIDGFEILSRIKKLSIHSKIIVLTAYGDSAIKNQALSLGADAYMTKPFNNFELIDLVKRTVK
ncbi:MAG: response regulator [Candidatus Cloacimonadales bacterium]|nr:response regulator [Candidatus Cloacimonadales bacterium]